MSLTSVRAASLVVGGVGAGSSSPVLALTSYGPL